MLWLILRALDAPGQVMTPAGEVDHYRPLLRLLSDEDDKLTFNLRAQRRDLFREQLRCLATDYGRLLAGLRLIMTQSEIDRPDLAKALVRNRVLFALALCRIDFRLRLYVLGIGTTNALRPEVLGLVDALNVLRGQFSFVESAVWGS